MQQIISINLPRAWQSPDDEQLRFVFRLLAHDYSLPQVKALCLLKWAGLHVLRQEGAIFVVE